MVDVCEPSGALHRESGAANGTVLEVPLLVEGGAQSQPEIRHIAFPDDAEWLKDLLLRKYSNNYDVVTTEAWFRHVVLPNPHLFYAIRSEHAFVLCGLRSTPWTPNDIEAVVSIVTADDGHVWECVQLLRESVNWARRRKAVQWSAFSETGVDLGPLMERIGSHVQPRFIVNLRGEA